MCIENGKVKKDVVRQSVLVYFALVAFVSALLIGAHGHFCPDGLEPPVSVHFDNLEGHPPHGGDQSLHQDADTKVVPEGVVNFFKVDLSALLPTLLLLLFWFATVHPRSLSFNFPPRWSIPLSIRPPLRAPPQ